MFNEETLYREIIRMWGPYGAHADVFRAMHKNAPNASPIDFNKINDEHRANLIREEG